MTTRLHVTSGILVFVGLTGASAQPGSDLAATQTPDNTTRSVFKNATTPTDFSGGAAGHLCVYDNYNPLDDFGAPSSQRDPGYPFYSEAADDFVGYPYDDL